MTRTEVRDLLLAAADPSFKEFNDKIINCEAAPSIGVRVPKVRELAGLVVKNGWLEYLTEMEQNFPVQIPAVRTGSSSDVSEASVIYQEEHLLWGIVLGMAKMDREERVYHLGRWIPGILSWGDCDCGTSTFKFMRKDQAFWYDYCTSWLNSRREFEVRFALVTLMQYFLNDAYIDEVLKIFAGHHGELWYIRMAQAWALSVCFVKYRDRTLELFSAKILDPWVQNKAIQKCRESYRVSQEDKELLKMLKM